MGKVIETVARRPQRSVGILDAGNDKIVGQWDVVVADSRSKMALARSVVRGHVARQADLVKAVGPTFFGGEAESKSHSGSSTATLLADYAAAIHHMLAEGLWTRRKAIRPDFPSGPKMHGKQWPDTLRRIRQTNRRSGHDWFQGSRQNRSELMSKSSAQRSDGPREELQNPPGWEEKPTD